MKVRHVAPCVGACLLLSACGGGSGGGGTTASTGTTAPPRNTTMGNLVASQTFASDAATETVALDKSAGVGVTGTIDANTLTISYDATAKSYTVTAPQGSQTFAAADLDKSSDATQSIYAKTSGTTSDRLTIVNVPYSSDIANKYVRMGFWQRNNSSGSIQDTNFSMFTFGLDTPATAVPRTGVAGFKIDVFAFGSGTNIAPFVVEGSGDFSVDFAKAMFTTKASLSQYDLVSGQSTVGGGMELNGSGSLSASSGTFSGLATVSSAYTQSGGTLSGRFYGPGAEEIGAAIAATSLRDDGVTISGALTGQRETSATPVNFTLTDIVTEQTFYGNTAVLATYPTANSPGVLSITGWNNTVAVEPNGAFQYSSPTSGYPLGQITAANAVTSADRNFLVYETGTGDNKLHIEMYKTGAANSELALTYTDFGVATSASSTNFGTEQDSVFFIYGIDTLPGLLAHRSGTASYAGVVYGAAADRTTSSRFDVRGTSGFVVDFGAQTFSGSLSMTARNAQGSIDLGSVGFADKLASGSMISTSLTRDGTAVGTINPSFKGPDGGEIAATFSANLATSGGAQLGIAGVTAAKRQ